MKQYLDLIQHVKEHGPHKAAIPTTIAEKIK